MAGGAADLATKRIAVVTGGNKGIGLEICRQLALNGVEVILTARDDKRGVEAVEHLQSCGLSSDVIFHILDVMDLASAASLASFIKTHFGKLDILVNNAGISGVTLDEKVHENVKPEYDDLENSVKQTYETAVACLRTNYYGVKQVTKELIPLLELSDSPRIVNISSTLGQLRNISNEKAIRALGDADNLSEEKIDEMVKEFLEDAKEDLLETNGWPSHISAYKVSKAALNAYTRVLAKEYPKIAIFAVCPGYTKTDINYNYGLLTVEEGARSPVRLALAPEFGFSGHFFDQMKASSF